MARQFLIGIVLGIVAVAVLMLLSKPRSIIGGSVVVREVSSGLELPGAGRTRVYDVRGIILAAGRFQQTVRAKVGKEPAWWKQREPDLAEVLIRAGYSSMADGADGDGRVEYFAGHLIVRAGETDHARVEAMLQEVQRNQNQPMP